MGLPYVYTAAGRSEGLLEQTSLDALSCGTRTGETAVGKRGMDSVCLASRQIVDQTLIGTPLS